MSNKTHSVIKKPCKVRQACDSCHLRKIRCDGLHPCTNCRDTAAACTFLAVHKKTGPKGGPRRPRLAAGPRRVTPAAYSRVFRESPGSPCVNSSTLPDPQLENVSCDIFRPSPQISTSVVKWALDAWFTHKYPITPMLHRQTVEDSLHQMSDSPEIYGLLSSCCAVMSLSPEILPSQPSLPSLPNQPALILPSTDFLISETLRARRYCNMVESQSLLHVQTSFLIFATFFCMDKDNATWFYLRESITMLQTLRLHEEGTYRDIDDSYVREYGRRMFWVLFITERAYALQRYRPLTLQATLALPQVSPESLDAAVLPGFLDLITLFSHFDASFIASWNSAGSTLSQNSESENLWRLQEALRYALPSVSNYTPMQQADLLISRQWLKVIVWKHCVSRKLLCSDTGDDSMSLNYPASIARDVVLICRLLPSVAFEANGVGILEKIFDISCSLADILLLARDTDQRSTMTIGPLDTLVELVGIVGTLLQRDYQHSMVLTDKVIKCLDIGIDRSLPLLI